MSRVWRIGPPVLTGSRLQRLADQCWRLARQGYKRKLTEARTPENSPADGAGRSTACDAGG